MLSTNIATRGEKLRIYGYHIRMNFNWEQMETEYVTTNISYKQLSEKYAVSTKQIFNHSRDGEWLKKRTKYRNRVADKVAKKTEEIAVSEAEEIAKLKSRGKIALWREVVRRIENAQEVETLDLQKLTNIYDTLLKEDVTIEEAQQEIGGIVLMPAQKEVSADKGGD